MTSDGATPEDRRVLTIGYGRVGIDVVLERLRSHRVTHVADVRSAPYSRGRPEFNRSNLEAVLEAAGIGYVFLGRELGGRPGDPDCYTSEGRVDYGIVADREWFRSGLERVRRGVSLGLRICLLCGEAKPETCHRTRLVSEALVRAGITVSHVDADGSPVSHEAVLGRLDDPQQRLDFIDAVDRSGGGIGTHSRVHAEPGGGPFPCVQK